MGKFRELLEKETFSEVRNFFSKNEIEKMQIKFKSDTKKITLTFDDMADAEDAYDDIYEFAKENYSSIIIVKNKIVIEKGEYTNEVKTHPDLKAYLDIFKKKGYKAKVQHGELNVPFTKGVTEEEAIEVALDILPVKWTKNSHGHYTSGDVTMSVNTFSGKAFLGLRT